MPCTGYRCFVFGHKKAKENQPLLATCSKCFPLCFTVCVCVWGGKNRGEISYNRMTKAGLPTQIKHFVLNKRETSSSLNRPIDSSKETFQEKD